MQAGQGLRCKGKTSQAIWIGAFYSEGHGDYSAFALDVEWYRRTPIPVCKVIRGDTSVGSAVDLAEPNRLRPTWAFIRPSDIERGERATASLAEDRSLRSVQSQRSGQNLRRVRRL